MHTAENKLYAACVNGQRSSAAHLPGGCNTTTTSAIFFVPSYFSDVIIDAHTLLYQCKDSLSAVTKRDFHRDRNPQQEHCDLETQQTQYIAQRYARKVENIC